MKFQFVLFALACFSVLGHAEQDRELSDYIQDLNANPSYRDGSRGTAPGAVFLPRLPASIRASLDKRSEPIFACSLLTILAERTRCLSEMSAWMTQHPEYR